MISPSLQAEASKYGIAHAVIGIPNQSSKPGSRLEMPASVTGGGFDFLRMPHNVGIAPDDTEEAEVWLSPKARLKWRLIRLGSGMVLSTLVLPTRLIYRRNPASGRSVYEKAYLKTTPFS
ncbi:hypothetical protein N7461_005910 [Penicillium sp. DV-2018c]|nr:hypothetical protein N7461_005910 [Penicillium sp. DV-2018c]